ncbi:membrane protein [Mesorhizobium sp. 131-2-1]|nr:membrane protein [Mesorhizobium sp. 131-2-1]
MNHVRFDTDADAKLAALRRTKLVAAAALALCVLVFALAKSFEGAYPWLGFVAAFAEAATIGGLADWYAVVALFRRPLGLPIPHTAIIPENQNRIADNLGRFIEVNFLAPEPVREKLAEVDFSALVADWLADAERAAGLSRFVVRLVPQTLAAVEQSGLRGFVTSRMLDEVEKVPLAPLAAELLSALTDDRRHQRLFDEFTRVIGRFLNDEEALSAMREKIREELPSLFNLFRADAYLLKKIVASAGTLLEEVRADPDHPMRAEFDRFAQGFIERLRTSKQYARRAEQLKRDFLARPEMKALAGNMWESLRLFIEQDARAENSLIRAHLANMFVEVGRHLAGDAQIRADMNQGFVVALSSFVDSQKSGVSKFIADQVKRWDLAQLTRLIEMNIGRDLQYIRFNGMIIGGLAGIVLYTAERLFLVN